jgi:hypothetical protein
MLLRFFKGTGPGVIFLIIITLLLVWASAFIKLNNHFSLYFDLEPMPLYGVLSDIIGTNALPGTILSVLLVSFMAFLLVNLNTALFFINERTFLPAVIYILLSGLFPQYQLLNPAFIAAVFLMLAIRRIMDAYRIQGTAYNFFDAAVLISIGSLFYANVLWFGLLVIIGLIILRTGNIKEIAISFAGLATPYIITFGVYYVLGKDLKYLVSLIEYNFFGRSDYYVFSRLTIVTLIFLGLSIITGIGYLFTVINNKKIKSRKTFSLLLWLLVISLVVYFAVPSVSVDIMPLTAIPVSYIMAHYFIFIRKKLVPELIFSLYFVFIILIQILSVKL